MPRSTRVSPAFVGGARPSVLVALFALVGCTAPPPGPPNAGPPRSSTPFVHLGAPPLTAETEVEPLDEAPALGCRIAGAGEVHLAHDRGAGRPFELFAATRGEAPPLAVVRYPHAVHVVWSDLPSVVVGTRARVHLGEQGLLRIDAFASLAGRLFQLVGRADVVVGHLWLRRGAAVEILGGVGERLRVALFWPDVSVRSLRADVACEALVFDPAPLAVDPAVAPPPGQDRLRAPGGRLSLSAAPGEAPLGEIPLGDAEFGGLERRGGAVHVVGSHGGLAFDGWVSTADVAPGSDLLSAWGRGSGSSTTTHTVAVSRDAPFGVGASPPGEPLGTIERGAEIALDASGGEVGSFVLKGHEIEPAPGLRFWVRLADVAPAGP